MFSDLDLARLGARIDYRPTGPAIDRHGWFFPTDGTLRAVGPPESTSTIREAIAERAAIANAIVDGTHLRLPLEFGRCSACGQPMQSNDAGSCMLCQAAVQKSKKDRGIPIGFAATKHHAFTMERVTSDAQAKFIATVPVKNDPTVDYPTAPWELSEVPSPSRPTVL